MISEAQGQKCRLALDITGVWLNPTGMAVGPTTGFSLQRVPGYITATIWVA